MTKQEDAAFEMIWDGLVSETQVRPSSLPKGFVLGGQPGAGKSNLVQTIRAELNRNLLVINGDEFRRYHPDFEEIQARYGKDAPKYTAVFSGMMTERVIAKALAERYNISVEGTFRTTEVPLGTLDQMRTHGYETSVYIQTTPAEVSWQSTIERYRQMEALGEMPRYTDKAHHDLVVELLPSNADSVFVSGKADHFRVYNRDGLVFDDRIHVGQMPGAAIDYELHCNERELGNIRADFQKNAHLLSPSKKQVIRAGEAVINGLSPAEQMQARINLYGRLLAQIKERHPPLDAAEPER
ncbi:zeta toxin family protein [Neisseria wadsworthii]|uniref:Zeta-toxin n=1 Tax=Neisseria wadsworthii 9715 TaxID=1030841 RepID=G4CN33_9NEIS|nr:zeta toxin family protein [Neisseria wadsworthii]EGZ50643.1 zeta-toxin [Neisseria wadsworthii 9715]QMT36487.1 zeta toxin family protein [Neisseria wadsworthii]